MEQLTAGKMFVNPIKYVGCRECKRKICTCGKMDMGECTFDTYKTQVDGGYVTIKGYGARDVQEGDTIEGDFSTRDYTTKTGQPATETIFTMPKKDLTQEVRKQQDEIAQLKAQLAKAQITPDKVTTEYGEPSQEYLDEIPF